MTDREAIYDALVRFTDSLDLNDAKLCESAFLSDAVFDGTAFSRIGFDYPVFTGVSSISASLLSAVGKLDTTHIVGNFRTQVDGDTAKATCNVTAQHFRKGEGIRVDVQTFFTNVNRYTADMVRDDDVWKMRKLVVVPLWSLGDIEVLKG